MNLLGGYGSGDDSDDESSKKQRIALDIKSKEQSRKEEMQFQTRKPQIRVLNSESSDHTNIKKKKIEILSFLPENIKAALQGDTSYDTESDTDGDTVKKKIVSKSSHNDGNLLAMLPKAKNDTANTNDQVSKSSSSSSFSSSISTSAVTDCVMSTSLSSPSISIPVPAIKSKFVMPLESSGGANDEYRYL